MTRRQTVKRHPLPAKWLLSDERNDAVLEHALRRIRPGSAFVFRDYHLSAGQRRRRFARLRRIARARGHLVILASDAVTARAWGADGWYGPPAGLRPRRTGLIALAAVHDMREIARANLLGADAALLSPVFPTRSHPGAKTLGPRRFRLLAKRAQMPVIALGGMDARRAVRLRWPRWAAIDGLSGGHPRPAA